MALAHLVIDDNWLPEMLAGDFGHAAKEDVNADAGLERHDQRDGLVRELRGVGHGRRSKAQ